MVTFVEMVLRDKGGIGDVRVNSPNSIAEGVGGMVRGHCLTANWMSSALCCCCASKLAEAREFVMRGS